MPTLVQSVSFSATAGTSVTVTLSATGSGHCLIVYFGARQGTTNPHISGITLGGGADSWALAKAVNTAGDPDAEIWTDQNAASGQTSVVISWTGGVGTGLAVAGWVEEWSGIASSAAVDKTNGTSAAAATSWSSGSTGTLSSANELVVGMVAAQLSSVTITGPSAPWANQATVTAGSAPGLSVLAGHETVSAATAQAYSGTFNLSVASGAVVVSLLEPAAPGAPAIQPPVTPRSRRGQGAVVTVPQRPAAARPQPVTALAVTPRPRPRGRAMVIPPRQLLASPPPVIPGTPVLLAPLPLRARARGRALVIIPRAVPPSPGPAGTEGGPVYYPYHHRGRGRTR